jgi:hypothetical protein
MAMRIHCTILPFHPYTFQACKGRAVLGDRIDNVQSAAIHTGSVFTEQQQYSIHAVYMFITINCIWKPKIHLELLLTDVQVQRTIFCSLPVV